MSSGLCESTKGGSSPLPKCYKFGAARERGFGFHSCSARFCFATETLESVSFAVVPVVRYRFYCGKECLASDWKDRLKFCVCAEARESKT